jgi:hypothetical protein
MSKRWGMTAAFAALLAVTAAPAALAGGSDCCADLEERVAELEATAVRKGNKKVSVKVSGQMSTGILVWDDGDESNIYVVDNDHASPRVNLLGSAKINDDWSAGYRIEFESEPANSARVDQFDDNDRGAGAAINLRHNYLYLESKRLGQVRVGLTEGAAKAITRLDAADQQAWTSADFRYASSFFLRPEGFNGELGLSNVRLGQIASCYGTLNLRAFDCQGRYNAVSYVSPEFWGFKARAAFGEDDIWDVGLVYDKELGNFAVKGGLAYAHYGDERNLAGAGGAAGFQADRDEFVASISAWHKPSGLFGSFYYSHGEDNDSRQRNAGVLTGTSFPEGEGWHVQAGIKKKWWETGYTSFFVNYTDVEDMLGGFVNNPTRNVTGSFSPFIAGAGTIELTGARIDSVGFGAAQTIDSAALDLFAVANFYDAEVDLVSANLGVTDVKFDRFFTTMIGGRIRF